MEKLTVELTEEEYHALSIYAWENHNKTAEQARRIITYELIVFSKLSAPENTASMLQGSAYGSMLLRRGNGSQPGMDSGMFVS